MSDDPSEPCNEPLKKVQEGMRYGDIQLQDVEDILANETFTSNMLVTTTKGQTLLHLAARGRIECVFPLVVQAYKRAKQFSNAMAIKDENGRNPLHVAIDCSNFENTVQLFKECVSNCPQGLEATDSGCTLLHFAANHADNVGIMKYLLSQEVCQPMLLAKWTNRWNCELTPLDMAKSLVWEAQQSVKFAIKHVEFCTRNKTNKSMKESMERSQVQPKKQVLEKAKELLSVIEQPSIEAKAKEAEKMAKEIEMKKFREKEEKINGELQDLLQSDNWSAILEKYLLIDYEETQKITVNFLAMSDVTSPLPPLSVEIVRVLLQFLDSPEEDQALQSALTLLGRFTKSEDNVFLLLTNEECLDGVAKVVSLLSSLNAGIQCQTAGVLVNLTVSKPESFAVPDEWVQPLLLVRHFSMDDTTKTLAMEALTNIGAVHKQPDPGCWSISGVSLWIESITSLEKRSEYRKAFAEAGIDGLHLLELSATEMTALGVKFVSDQRKLSNSVDELRRMNVRSVVGRKDVFLSYAHRNISFGRRIKRALNDANYTVWIDEAGIRAGQKWRNEIADGIQGCRVMVFIMTPRSANSEYCQDELALAEEYKKPIFTLKLENISEMDPGLKLMIQRRQWIDFSSESEFKSNCEELTRAISSAIGAGSGPEREETDHSGSIQHSPEQSQPEHTTTTTTEFMPDVIISEITKLRNDLRGEMEKIQQTVEALQAKVEDLTDRVSTMEMNGH